MIRPEGASQMHAGSGIASTSESSNEVGEICGMTKPRCVITIRGNQLFRVFYIEHLSKLFNMEQFSGGPGARVDFAGGFVAKRCDWFTGPHRMPVLRAPAEMDV